MLRAGLVMSIVFSGYVVAAGPQNAPDDAFSTDAPPVVRACGIAYADFKEHVQSAADHATPLGRFVSDVNNYEITIIPSKETIVVRFGLQEFNGSLIRGGGYIYTLDANGRRIMSLKMTR